MIGVLRVLKCLLTSVSSPGPLDRGCQELIFPACQNKGYNHTLISVEGQKKMYSWIYRTNYTKGNVSKEFPSKMEEELAKYPKCRANLEKLFCADFFPPCFPGEGPMLYTLCHSVCQEIMDDCFVLLKEDYKEYQFYCTRLAEGNTSHGFCKHTRWPNPSDWHFFESKDPKTSLFCAKTVDLINVNYT